MNKIIAIANYNNDEEFNIEYMELYKNPDFSYIGSFSEVQDIYDEFEYQGFSEEQLNQLTNNRYGLTIEILTSPENDYNVFYGNH